MATSRVESTVDRLLDLVTSGAVQTGDPLPAEAALAAQLEVSRLTLREAVKVLADRGVLEPIHGRGTFVRPPHQWTDLAAIIAWQSRTSGPRDIALQLVEIRQMIEIGAAGLAAERRSDDDVTRLAEMLETYHEAHSTDSIAETVRTDLEFHDLILRATGNPFLLTVFDPIKEALRTGRTQTSSHRAVREHAIVHHEAILEAIREGDADQARRAMRAHMVQTAGDVRTYLPAH